MQFVLAQTDYFCVKSLKKDVDKLIDECYSISKVYIFKAMTKKAELQRFQRGGVWCEPSAKQFKSYPFRAEAPKTLFKVSRQLPLMPR